MGAVIEFLQPMLNVVAGISLPVKLLWAVWLVWAVAQVVWWRGWQPRFTRPAMRQSASPRSTVPASAARRPVAVRPAPKKAPAAAPVAPYGTSDFLAVLDQEQAAQVGSRER